MTRFLLLNERHHSQVAALEGRSYPEDEAASPERLAFRMREAPRFFCGFGSGVPESDEEEVTIVAFVCGTLIASESYTHRSLSSHEKEGTTLCIHSVVVDADHRRSGVGTRLLRKYIEHVRELNGKQLNVERICLLCKQHLIRFYEGVGFENLGPSDVVHGQDQWFEMRFNMATS